MQPSVVGRASAKTLTLAVAGMMVTVTAGGGGACARGAVPCPAAPSTVTLPHPTREHCLAPPWTIDPRQPLSGRPGWSAATCAEGPGVAAYFIHEGKREITSRELQAMVSAMFAKGVGTVGTGGCCSAEVAARHKVSCVMMWIDICQASMTEIVGWIDEELTERGLADVRVGTHISVGGPRKPRCTPTNPTCGPEPSSRWRPPLPRTDGRCSERRIPLPLASSGPDGNEILSGGTCAHDGECTIRSCGQSCVPWNTGGGSEWCEMHLDPTNAYCGCVSDRCTWFRTPAN